MKRNVAIYEFSNHGSRSLGESPVSLASLNLKAESEPRATNLLREAAIEMQNAKLREPRKKIDKYRRIWKK